PAIWRRNPTCQKRTCKEWEPITRVSSRRYKCNSSAEETNMSTPVIAFFNNKGGVGKTSLVYHLSWMYVDLGLRVVVADLDPQANLTAAFLDEDRLEELWPRGDHPDTIFGCIQPLIRGVGDIAEPHLEQVELDAQQPSLFGSSLALLVGDLLLSSF